MTYFVFFSRGGGGKLGKLNGKDMMYNDLIDLLDERNVRWPAARVESKGKLFLEVRPCASRIYYFRIEIF